MKVQKKIDVSMSGCYLPCPVKVVASDTAIQLVLRYVDLEIPSNAKATLFVMKPSKNFVYQTDDITISGNVVTINVKNQAIIEKGRAYFTVTITSGEDSISTFENYFDVDRNYKESNAEESRSMISEFEKTLDELRAGSIQIEEIEGGHRVTLKDVNGPHVFNVMDGEDGKNGDDGYSPTVDVSKSGKETTIKITDKNGEHTSTIKDGEDGEDGTSCTHSWDGTTLTVNSASGSFSANLKGEKGDKGDTGNNGIHVGSEPPVDENIEVWVDTTEEQSVTQHLLVASINNGIDVVDSGLVYSRGVVEVRLINGVLWVIDSGVYNFTDSFETAKNRTVLQFDLPKELSNKLHNTNGAYGTTGTIGYFPALAYENVTYTTFNCQSYLKRSAIGEDYDTFQLVYTGLSAVSGGGLCGFHLKMPLLLV